MSAGIMGDIVIDDNGDREPNYWLWHLTPAMNDFEYWTDIKMTNKPFHVNIDINTISQLYYTRLEFTFFVAQI